MWRCSALDVPFPARYHRLGTFIIETRKRFGDEEVKKFLRQQQIDSTTAWRAVQIATLYSFDQAVAFASLRAILKTLPPKQHHRPRKKPTGGSGDHLDTAPPKPTSANNEDILDRFIQLGIRLRELLGDEAIDKAVEQIKSHVPETFEEAFAEV